MSAVVFVLGSYFYNCARLGRVLIQSGFSLEVCSEFIRLAKAGDMSTESISSCEFALICDQDMLPSEATSAKSEVLCGLSFPELKAGTCFIVNGIVLKTCERFSINLLSGTNPSKQDVALHFNPRLPQNYIVRNSRVSNKWNKEECSSPFPFELLRGHQFRVEILVTDTEYLLAVNSKHFGSFAHRVPLKKVTAIEIKGDVKEVEIEQVNLERYPTIEPASIPNISQNNNDSVFDQNLTRSEFLELPFYGDLRGFGTGLKLHVQGRVKMLPHSFIINLQQGSSIWPHSIIPLHLNPRFGHQGGKHVICRNSWNNGEWGKEERIESQADFMPGKQFDLAIACHDRSYQIYLNGMFIADYPFRCDGALVDTVYIQGDIKLKKLYLEEHNDAADSRPSYDAEDNNERSCNSCLCCLICLN